MLSNPAGAPPVAAGAPLSRVALVASIAPVAAARARRTGASTGRARATTVGILAALLALLGAAPARAAREVPRLSGRVVDEAAVLDAATRESLTRELAALERRTTAQVAVLTVPTLDGEALEDFSLRVATAWKLGQKGKDNGVLVLVVSQDRKARIEVGYGLEGTLTDLACGRIIRSVMIPAFRSGDYGLGIRSGVQAVMDAIEGRPWAVPDDAAPSAGAEDSPLDLGPQERLLIGAFVFGALGLFAIVGLCLPRVGWFLYVFLIPFWGAFPIVILGTRRALVLLAAYLVGFPIVKLLLRQTAWYRNGGLGRGSGGRGGGWSSSSRSSSSSSSSFSGGGGSFGGGGASGSW